MEITTIMWTPPYAGHPLDQHPLTLLSIAVAAPLLNKSQSTLQVDATRRPESLPTITKVGRRVFFQVKDVIDFLDDRRVSPTDYHVRAKLKKQTSEVKTDTK